MPIQALCTVAEAVKLNAFAFSLTLDVGEELAGQVRRCWKSLSMVVVTYTV